MGRFVELIDRAPSYLPEQVKPVLRPLFPIYAYTETQIYRLLPERVSHTPWGPKIHVDPANYVERRLVQGTFETETIDYFRDLVNGHDGRFADIGANVGFFSILYDSVSEDDGTADAFEPLGSNRDRMNRNIALNDSVTVNVYPFGFSDSMRTDELWVSDSNPGEASLSERLYSGSSSYAVEIELRRLDDFYPISDGSVPDLCKIDVEGAEVQVVRGGQELLTEHHPELLLELHRPLLSEFGDSVDELIAILSEAGYTTAYNVESGRELTIPDLSTTINESPHFHIT